MADAARARSPPSSFRLLLFCISSIISSRAFFVSSPGGSPSLRARPGVGNPAPVEPGNQRVLHASALGQVARPAAVLHHPEPRPCSLAADLPRSPVPSPRPVPRGGRCGGLSAGGARGTARGVQVPRSAASCEIDSSAEQTHLATDLIIVCACTYWLAREGGDANASSSAPPSPQRPQPYEIQPAQMKKSIGEKGRRGQSARAK